MQDRCREPFTARDRVREQPEDRDIKDRGHWAVRDRKDREVQAVLRRVRDINPVKSEGREVIKGLAAPVESLQDQDIKDPEKSEGREAMGVREEPAALPRDREVMADLEAWSAPEDREAMEAADSDRVPVVMADLEDPDRDLMDRVRAALPEGLHMLDPADREDPEAMADRVVWSVLSAPVTYPEVREDPGTGSHRSSEMSSVT